MPTKPIPSAHWFEKLSDSALIRVDRIIKTPSNPFPLVDASRSTWWRWVSERRVPQPIRPSPGTTLWKVGSLRRWLQDPGGYTALKIDSPKDNK